MLGPWPDYKRATPEAGGLCQMCKVLAPAMLAICSRIWKVKAAGATSRDSFVLKVTF